MNKVKRITAVLGTFIIAMMLTACPLESTVDLENIKKIKVNEDLIGTWKRSLKAEDSTEIIFKKFDDYNYSVSARMSYLGEKFKTTNFKAKILKVNKNNILSLFDEESQLYYFAQWDLYSNGGLSLYIISGESLEPLHNSKEVLNFLNTAYETEKIAFEPFDLNNLIKTKNN